MAKLVIRVNDEVTFLVEKCMSGKGVVFWRVQVGRARVCRDLRMANSYKLVDPENLAPGIDMPHRFDSAEKAKVAGHQLARNAYEEYKDNLVEVLDTKWHRVIVEDEEV